ncbi:MAG: prepilin-type N-terminal cleavage/methylation domain-containing protein [Rhodopila sp.]|nr:prepilin-type N-terminal cleavage/methylation domain-containing protein [Rhodopila sp.]
MASKYKSFPAASSYATSANERSKPGQVGFTLIEMIIVIVILALVAGLVLVRQPWHSAGLDTDATVRALSNALRLARSRAIAQDREIVVVTAASGFSVDGGAAWLLPSGEALSLTRVIFTPDGGSSGATILLAAGPRRIAVDVNWLTGRVRARELDTQQ